MRCEPLFAFDDGVYTLSSMLQQNAHDDEVCEWLRSSHVGDVFGGHAPCERISYALVKMDS